MTAVNGKLHSIDDLPSVKGDFVEMWHKDGELHRENDLPAYLESNLGGSKLKWYKKGQYTEKMDQLLLKLRIAK